MHDPDSRAPHRRGRPVDVAGQSVEGCGGQAGQGGTGGAGHGGGDPCGRGQGRRGRQRAGPAEANASGGRSDLDGPCAAAPFRHATPRRRAPIARSGLHRAGAAGTTAQPDSSDKFVGPRRNQSARSLRGEKDHDRQRWDAPRPDRRSGAARRAADRAADRRHGGQGAAGAGAGRRRHPGLRDRVLRFAAGGAADGGRGGSAGQRCATWGRRSS